MAQQPIDIEMPGAPVGPGAPFWPNESDPWRDMPNPWPTSPASPNGGGRVPVPGGKDPDGRGPTTN